MLINKKSVKTMVSGHQKQVSKDFLEMFEYQVASALRRACILDRKPRLKACHANYAFGIK